VSAWVLARYQPEEAWRFLQHALESDIADVQGGTTAEGIHLGAMAGTVDIVLRCLTGLRPRGDALHFDPALPPQVKQVRFSVHYRGHRVDVTLAEDRLEVGSRPGRAQPIKVLVRDQTLELAPGARHEVHLGPRP
jgi:trehalose/maltose hydrolase-like predicted phosphorylase